MISDADIFKRGSTTYYFSSKFFPKKTREDVLKLYSFVRVADNFVDAVPQQVAKFTELETTWRSTVKNRFAQNSSEELINHVVRNMYDVTCLYDFDVTWVTAFLDSMRMDIDGKVYETMDDTLKYIYGSAEVIGLMMAKILGVSSDAYEYAKLQGRAMQYINFIRDIDEDIQLGRCYFPQTELAAYGLENLTTRVIMRHRADYREFIEAQLRYYSQWQQQANNGFKMIPRRQRIALRTAVDMYNWTALKLADDPFVVFDKKVKPSKLRVVTRAMIRSVNA